MPLIPLGMTPEQQAELRFRIKTEMDKLLDSYIEDSKGFSVPPVSYYNDFCEHLFNVLEQGESPFFPADEEPEQPSQIDDL